MTGLTLSRSFRIEKPSCGRSTGNSTYTLASPQKGGGVWETLSRPNWDLFDWDSYGLDPNDGEITSTSRKLTEEFLRVRHQQSFSEDLLVPESVKWEILTPWQATYWKELPEGHRVSFLYERNPEWEKNIDSFSPDPEFIKQDRQHSEFRRRRMQWYQPYEPSD